MSNYATAHANYADFPNDTTDFLLKRAMLDTGNPQQVYRNFQAIRAQIDGVSEVCDTLDFLAKRACKDAKRITGIYPELSDQIATLEKRLH